MAVLQAWAVWIINLSGHPERGGQSEIHKRSGGYPSLLFHIRADAIRFNGRYLPVFDDLSGMRAEKNIFWQMALMDRSPARQG